MKFEEDRAFRKSHDTVPIAARDQELEALKADDTQVSQVTGTQSSEQEEEQKASPTQEIPSTSRRRRPRWLDQTLRDAQEHVEAPRKTFRESKPLKKFSSYMKLMSDINDSKPSTFQEATSLEGCHKWKSSSIMKNDVCVERGCH